MTSSNMARKAKNRSVELVYLQVYTLFFFILKNNHIRQRSFNLQMQHSDFQETELKGEIKGLYRAECLPSCDNV